MNRLMHFIGAMMAAWLIVSLITWRFNPAEWPVTLRFAVVAFGLWISKQCYEDDMKRKGED